ncbi:MAG: extracellular solute-binding protein [Firmicutes bacterium]|nr:extracellular solute-binding protein [Bacillota bacterium]
MKRLVMRTLCLVLLLGLVVGGISAEQKVRLNLFFYKQEIVSQMKELTDAFSAKYPNIEISLEIVPNESMAVLRTRMAGGNAPDIIQLQSYASVFEFARAGWLADLSKEPVMKKVVPATLNSVTYKGKQYALPMDVAGIGIIYNKDLFAKYGVKPPTTFSELKSVCATLKAKGVTPFASMFKVNWSVGHFLSMVHTTLAGEKLLPWLEKMNQGKASFADPVNVKQLFSILDFYKANSDPNAAEMDWNEQQAAFAGGKAAMMVQGLWSYGAAKSTNPKLNCGFIPFPCTDDPKDTKLFADVDSTFALSATSSRERLKAAKLFLEWLASPEAIKIWVERCKLVPTFKGADVKSMDQPFQDLVYYLNSGRTNPWAFAMYPVAVWEDATKNGAQEYLLGRKTPEQVIAYIDEVWRREIAK